MIKNFTIQIKELDAYTIENEPIASIDLMERAASSGEIISERWEWKPFDGICRPRQQWGDALVVSRLLAEQGYRVEVYLFNTKGTLSPDCETNKERLAGFRNRFSWDNHVCATSADSGACGCRRIVRQRTELTLERWFRGSEVHQLSPRRWLPLMCLPV